VTTPTDEGFRAGRAENQALEVAEAHRRAFVELVLDGKTTDQPTGGDWALASHECRKDTSELRLLAHGASGEVLREVAIVSTEDDEGLANAALLVGASGLFHAAREVEDLLLRAEQTGELVGTWRRPVAARIAALTRALDVCRGKVRA
jgi:hypothetical protein